MTTSSSYLSLTLYNNTTDQSASFITWTRDMSGSGNSNMRKIDNWSGSASGSITRLSGSASGSAANISASIVSVSGSIATLMSTASALGLRIAKIAEFSSTGQADFTSISASYTHLLMIGVAASTYATDVLDLSLDFNGDANSANYSSAQWDNIWTATNVETFDITQAIGSIKIGLMPGASAANYGVPFIVLIPNYSGSGGLYKTAMGISAFARSSTPSDDGTSIGIQGGTWISTSAINRVRVFGTYGTSSQRRNLATGTKISLYGIG